MQAKAPTEHELVKICMSELCCKAGFADPDHMVQRDLQYLCDSIESQTGVLISLSTIKRLLNGQFSRLPQIATLNAVAGFLGYQNWQSFKITKGQTPGTTEDAAIATNPSRQEEPIAQIHSRANRFAHSRSLFIGAILFLAVLGLLAIMKIRKTGVSNIESATFSAVKVTSNDLPNTVVFSYNVDEVGADSFFIQQSWDKNRRVKISRQDHTLTDIYFEPGYHRAKLIANNQIIKTVDVHIPTDRWFFYTKERIAGSQPKYITPAKETSNGSMLLTRDDLLNNQIDPQKKNQYFQVYFPTAIGSSSDDFIFKFRIRVNTLNNDLCPYFMSEIFCQRNFMYFVSGLKGCSSDLSAQFGETLLNGKTHDFSALGIDVKTWQNAELRVNNKKVSVSLNGKEVFATAYQQSCGLITGIGFISNGLCEVDFVDLKTTGGKDIYSNDFNH
jgi:hypothetical protein